MTFYGEDYPEPFDPGPPDNPTLVSDNDPLRHVHDGSYLDGLTFPPMRWAVPGLVPEGLTLLAGAPKLGKSWLALDLSLAVASGGKALGAIPVDQGEVLYLALEDGERRLHSRIRTLIGDEPTPRAFHYQSASLEFRLDVQLSAYMERRPETRLVVIDTVGRVRPPTKAQGNTYSEDYAWMGGLQGFALRHRLAVIAVHHTRKASADDFVDQVSGTNGIAGAADVVMVLRRARGEVDAELKVTARDFVEQDLNLRRAGAAWLLFDRPVVDPDVGEPMARVLRVVALHEDGISPRDVAAALPDMDSAVVATYLGRAEKAGRLRKPRRALYAPVKSVESVESSSHHIVTDREI